MSEEISGFFEPVYKGSTSPSTVFGVPMLPFILGAVVGAQAFVLSFYFIGLPAAAVVLFLFIAALVWARRISRNDDQRLLQWLLKIRMRGPQRASKHNWGAVSFAPTSPRKK